MSITAWKVNQWRSYPEKKTSEREPKTFYVTAGGRREAKTSLWQLHFLTEQEALDCIAARKSAEDDSKKLKLIEKAAPDLLAALEDIYAIIEREKTNLPLCFAYSHSKARAAIASAKGESV
jgi:hypothetical protein